MEVFDFGERLQQLRKKQKLSQLQVANRLEITKGTISGYENNISYPSAEILIKLAIIYKSSTDYILGLNDRSCIYLDDLTPRQIEVIKSATDLIISEFRLENNSK